jgi:hypothetical protein
VRTLDSGVELAVENVVLGAAGAAHAYQIESEMPEVGSAMDGKARERCRLPAWGEQ